MGLHNGHNYRKHILKSKYSPVFKFNSPYRRSSFPGNRNDPENVHCGLGRRLYENTVRNLWYSNYHRLSTNVCFTRNKRPDFSR